jgi:hypothetical protein
VRSILVVMAAVAIAFAVVIWFGFWIHTKTNAIPDNVFGAVAYVGIFAIAFFLTCLALKISPWSGWTVQEMFGPKAVKQRPVVSYPKSPSTAQIAYLLNPEATATCEHLQPIERAMRAAGIEVRLLEASAHGPIVRATCRVNDGELRSVFQLPPSVYYREGEEPDRGQFGTPRADIFCGYCLKTDRARCDIWVMHPRECVDGTPWFPTAPQVGARG